MVNERFQAPLRGFLIFFWACLTICGLAHSYTFTYSFHFSNNSRSSSSAERLPASVVIYCMWISALKAYTWVSNNPTSIPSSSKGPKPTCFNLLFSAVTVCTSLIWRRKTVCCDTTCTGVPLWEQAAHIPWTACVSVCVSSGWPAPSPLPNCQLLHYTQWGVRGEY